MEPSFEVRDERVILGQKTFSGGNGSTTNEIPVDSESAIQSGITRYGHLLGADSAAELHKTLAGIVETAGGS